MDRAKLDVDTLLKIVLVLIVVWLVLEIIGGVLGHDTTLPCAISRYSAIVALTLTRAA